MSPGLKDGNSNSQFAKEEIEVIGGSGACTLTQRNVKSTPSTVASLLCDLGQVT